ncbi:MAG: hypothetical protein NZL96_03685 [Patescibacteria group bacterium]|nr:hypothetical protein [Patescibacteria group bacterium]
MRNRDRNNLRISAVATNNCIQKVNNQDFVFFRRSNAALICNRDEILSNKDTTSSLDAWRVTNRSCNNNNDCGEGTTNWCYYFNNPRRNLCLSREPNCDNGSCFPEKLASNQSNQDNQDNNQSSQNQNNQSSQNQSPTGQQTTTSQDMPVVKCAQMVNNQSYLFFKRSNASLVCDKNEITNNNSNDSIDAWKITDRTCRNSDDCGGGVANWCYYLSEQRRSLCLSRDSSCDNGFCLSKRTNNDNNSQNSNQTNQGSRVAGNNQSSRRPQDQTSKPTSLPSPIPDPCTRIGGVCTDIEIQFQKSKNQSFFYIEANDQSAVDFCKQKYSQSNQNFSCYILQTLSQNSPSISAQRISNPTNAPTTTPSQTPTPPSPTQTQRLIPTPTLDTRCDVTRNDYCIEWRVSRYEQSTGQFPWCRLPDGQYVKLEKVETYSEVCNDANYPGLVGLRTIKRENHKFNEKPLYGCLYSVLENSGREIVCNPEPGVWNSECSYYCELPPTQKITFKIENSFFWRFFGVNSEPYESDHAPSILTENPEVRIYPNRIVIEIYYYNDSFIDRKVINIKNAKDLKELRDKGTTFDLNLQTEEIKRNYGLLKTGIIVLKKVSGIIVTYNISLMFNVGHNRDARIF